MRTVSITTLGCVTSSVSPTAVKAQDKALQCALMCVVSYIVTKTRDTATELSSCFFFLPVSEFS